jgi:hypothetical protein
LIVLSLTVVSYEVKKAEQAARRLLRDSLALKLGVSSAQDVVGITRGPGRVTDPGFKECLAQQPDCSGMVFVRNRWLKTLHLAPEIGFGSLFEIKDNILIDRDIQMIAIINSNDLHAFVNEEKSSPNEPTFRVERFSNHTGLGIVMTPDAGDEFRRSVTDFDLRCLSRIGGCSTFEEMLPVLGREDWTWLAHESAGGGSSP